MQRTSLIGVAILGVVVQMFRLDRKNKIVTEATV